MKYGRTKAGEKWRRLHDNGIPICFDREMQIVEVVDSGEGLDIETLCENCDAGMREKGKRAREAQVLEEAVKAAARLDVYEPRHKFRER